MYQFNTVELFVGYMPRSKTEESFLGTIRDCGAGGGLLNVEKRQGWSHGFAVYKNNSTATKATQIVCICCIHAVYVYFQHHSENTCNIYSE